MGRPPRNAPITLPLYEGSPDGVRETLQTLGKGSVFTVRAVSAFPRKNDLGMLGLERECSTYGSEEDRFPDPNTPYTVIDKCNEVFYELHPQKIEDNYFMRDLEEGLLDERRKPFRANVFYVESLNVDERSHPYGIVTTWMMREDGLILNIESYSIRGTIVDILFPNGKHVAKPQDISF
jgi:hypothetical protein